jgi:hypothetical protein
MGDASLHHCFCYHFDAGDVGFAPTTRQCNVAPLRGCK